MIKYASCVLLLALSLYIYILSLCLCIYVIYLSLYQIRTDLQKGLQQHEETLSQTLTKHEQRINNIRVDLNLLEEQITQRMSQVSL